MKRKRRANDHEAPFFNIVAYLERDLVDPAGVLARMLGVMREVLDDHEVLWGVLTHKPITDPTQSSATHDEHRDKLSTLTTQYLANVLTHATTDSRLDCIGASVLRHWSISYYACSNHLTGWTQLPKLSDRAELSRPNLDPQLSVTFYYDIHPGGASGSAGRWTELVRSVVRILDEETSCYYALTDFDRAATTQFGHYYGPHAASNWMSWRQKIEYLDWELNGQGEGNRRRVRDMTWAHYLGPEMAKRLDSDGKFLERFLVERGRLRALPVGERMPRGGLFLACTPDPMFMLKPPSILDDNTDSSPVRHAVWLWNEFRKAGLL